MSEKSNGLPKAASDPIWTILPSYYMYQSTFYGELDPPEYGEGESVSDTHASCALSQQSSGQLTGATSLSHGSRLASTTPTTADGSFIVADESTTSWRETLLDNIQSLRNLTDSDNEYSKGVNISVHFTENVGEKGVAPKHIDPLNFEYKQGDFLNGYILIRNEGTKPLPFDMFYVLFEGNFVVSNSKDPFDKKPVKVRKFLEMFDFAASYSEVTLVNRILSEHGNVMGSCPLMIDPYDNTHLHIEADKVLHPGITYKRFFNFKIPVRLLDSECNDHNLTGHTELPPTLGMSLAEKSVWKSAERPISDFSFIDASTNYAVLARIIGKANKYGAVQLTESGTKLINARGDEFIILKEYSSFIRILQESVILSDREKEVNKEASRVLYENFVSRIKEKLAVGKELLKAIESLDDNKTMEISHRLAAMETVRAQTQNDTVKARQLYTRTNSNRDVKVLAKGKTYDIIVPIAKKQVFGHPKPIGTLMMSTPKTEYRLNYISPKRFRVRIPCDPSSWTVEIPLDFSYTPSSMGPADVTKFPEIRSLQAELVVFTLKSNNRPIPVELNHDFLFKNAPSTHSKTVRTDNFTHLIKKPMQEYATELRSLAKLLGTNNFAIERSLVDDLSAMCNADEKYLNLVLRDLTIVDSKGQRLKYKRGVKVPWTKGEGLSFRKQFSVVVDVTKAQRKTVNIPALTDDYKSYDEFTLVPSFQTCLVSRLYYFRFLVSLSNDEIFEFKLPLSIAKT